MEPSDEPSTTYNDDIPPARLRPKCPEWVRRRRQGSIDCQECGADRGLGAGGESEAVESFMHNPGCAHGPHKPACIADLVNVEGDPERRAEVLGPIEADGCPGVCPLTEESCRPECPGDEVCRHELWVRHASAPVEPRCPPKHFAGVVTGVVIKDGMRQVLCALAIPGTDKHMAMSLPLSEEELAAWAGELEGKVVLTLSLVEG